MLYFIFISFIIIRRIFNGIHESNYKFCVYFWFEGNETLEKLASMSLIGNLVVYLHTQYNLDIAVSAQVFNIWNGLTNVLPILGAYLADAHLGKFKILIFGSISSLLVNIVNNNNNNNNHNVAIHFLVFFCHLNQTDDDMMMPSE